MGAAGFDGSFPPIVQYEKWEIHTVFPHFSYFRLGQNLASNLLAPLCGVTLKNPPKSDKYPQAASQRTQPVFLFKGLHILPCWCVTSKNCNLAGLIRSISFDQLINIDAEGNIDFPVGKISIYQNDICFTIDICFAIDMCMALDMRCAQECVCPANYSL